ncbi:MAG: hypothetical protein ACRCW7_08450 [Cetobacterium sp.]
MNKRSFYILNIFLVLSLKIFALNFDQFWLRGPRELLPLVELGASWKVPN